MPSSLSALTKRRYVHINQDSPRECTCLICQNHPSRRYSSQVAELSHVDAGQGAIVEGFGLGQASARDTRCGETADTAKATKKVQKAENLEREGCKCELILLKCTGNTVVPFVG